MPHPVSETAEGSAVGETTVLVVDDTEAHRYTVARWLEDAGFRVRQAGSGTEALSLAGSGVDLVVLDVNLPDLHGFDVVARLKTDDSTGHLPVLHLSAVRIAPVDRVAGLTAGADAYLTYPVTAAELVAEVTALLRRSTVERTLREQNTALRDAVGGAEQARASADQARLAAERADRAKTQFLTNMSHELRTPLNAIQGHAQLLSMGAYGPVTPEQREALERIDRAQRHLLGLVNDVLNFARLGSGHVEYEVRPVLVGHVVTDILPMLAAQVAAKQLRLSVELSDAAAVWADREKLGQVFLNLLGNAVKFTPRGGRIAVELAAHQEEADPSNTVHFRVTDTGIGIPHDMLELIFEPFVQVRSERAGDSGGTGLGLAISRELVRGMGGELWARSVEGEGSTFTIALRRVVYAPDASVSAAADPVPTARVAGR